LLERFIGNGKKDNSFRPTFGWNIKHIKRIEPLPEGRIKLFGTFSAEVIDTRYPSTSLVDAELVLDVHGAILTHHNVSSVYVEEGDGYDCYPIDPNAPMVNNCSKNPYPGKTTLPKQAN
jgi:hypothetical protein